MASYYSSYYYSVFVCEKAAAENGTPCEIARGNEWQWLVARWGQAQHVDAVATSGCVIIIVVLDFCAAGAVIAVAARRDAAGCI